MTERDYYLVAFHGNDAQILLGPCDISEIDYSTIYHTKEEFMGYMEVMYDIHLPEESTLGIVHDKHKKGLRYYSALFYFEEISPWDSYFIESYPEFAYERIRQYLAKSHKLSIENTPKKMITLENGETKIVDFNSYTNKMISRILSNRQFQMEMTGKNSILSLKLKEYLLQCVRTSQYDSTLRKCNNLLKQYKEFRALSLQYAQVKYPEINIIEEYPNYYASFYRALRNYQAEKSTPKEDPVDYDLEEVNNGESSIEEYREKNEYRKYIGKKP